MQTYICKCGKTFEKSSKSDSTGYVLTNYSPQHECYGCPYIVIEREWQTKEIIKRECRATPKITYHSFCQIGTEDKDYTACHLYSLDLVFVKRVLNYVNSLEGAENNTHAIPDEWRAADFGHCYRSKDVFGLGIFPLFFQKNKKGTAARREVMQVFFNEQGFRKVMTEESEKQVVLQRIEIAKENARMNNKAYENMSNKEEKKVGAFNISSFMSQQDQLKNIELDMLVPYHKHPFKLYTGERLNDMVESIKANGVLVPAVVQPTGNGKYEILVGHNRWNSSKLAGKTTLPCIVKEGLSEDEAEMYVIESNLMQRGFDDLSITERASVLAARHSAMFDEDKRRAIENELAVLNGDEIKVNEETEDGKKKSKLEAAGEEYGLSRNSVARFIRIDKLVNELKPSVDDGNISIRAAVELSYLSENEQRKVAKLIEFGVDMKKSVLLRRASEQKELTDDTIREILVMGTYGVAPTTKRKPIKVKISTDISEKYFAPDWDDAKVQEIINKALEQYFSENNSPVGNSESGVETTTPSEQLIEDLDISEYAINAIKGQRINTVEKLLELDEITARNILGSKVVQELIDKEII